MRQTDRRTADTRPTHARLSLDTGLLFITTAKKAAAVFATSRHEKKLTCRRQDDDGFVTCVVTTCSFTPTTPSDVSR